MALVKAKKNGAPDPVVGTPEVDPRAGLADTESAVRRQAAHRLAGDAGAVPLLVDRLAVEAEPGVREAILTTLVRIGTGGAVEALLPLLAREDAGLRNAVLESIQQMPADAVAPAVVPLLDHADSDLRIFAVQLAGRLHHPDRLAWLAGVLQRDPHVNVCLAVVEALGEIGDPAALPALERLALRFPEDPMVGFSVEAARRRFLGG